MLLKLLHKIHELLQESNSYLIIMIDFHIRCNCDGPPDQSNYKVWKVGGMFDYDSSNEKGWKKANWPPK